MYMYVATFVCCKNCPNVIFLVFDQTICVENRVVSLVKIKYLRRLADSYDVSMTVSADLSSDAAV